VTHKRFKRLVDQWIDLSIEHSRLTMQIGEPKATGRAGTRYSQGAYKWQIKSPSADPVIVVKPTS
jgi:hypothetical protein